MRHRNTYPKELEKYFPKSKFQIFAGKVELQVKLDISICVAKVIAPDRWTVVTRAQLDPPQFPGLLLKRYPEKQFFIVFTLESFLPDLNYGPEDLLRIFNGCSAICENHDVQIYAILNDPGDDEFWEDLKIAELSSPGRDNPQVN